MTRLSLPRVGRGLLLAPLLPMVITAASQPLGGLSFIIYSYAISLISGLPMLLVYELLGMRRLWQYVVGGFFIPMAVGLGIQLTIAYEPGLSWETMLSRSASLGALCAIGSATFWFIAIRPPQPAS